LKDNGGLFDKFEWIHDPYGTEQKIRKDEAKLKEEKVIEMHDQHFNPA